MRVQPIFRAILSVCGLTCSRLAASAIDSYALPSTVTATAHGGTLTGSNESGLSRRLPRLCFGLSASDSPVAGSK